MNTLLTPTRTRADDTSQKLRNDILQGLLSPGTLLAEAAVARQLGVSRVPVREALFTLEREGLVEFSSTGRAYVKELAPHDFEELFMLRLSLEPLAARLAVASLSKNTSRLEENIAAMERERVLMNVTRLDLDFHQIIMEASGQRRMTRFWISLRSELELWLGRMHRTLEDRIKNTRETTIRSHTEILHCFQEGKAAAVERLSREHLQGWRTLVPSLINMEKGGVDAD